MSSEQERAEAASSHTPPERLRALAHGADATLALLLAQNASTPEDALHELAQSAAAVVWKALLQNPSTPLSLLLHFGPRAPGLFWENPALSLLALEDPGVYRELLTRARASLLSHPSAPGALVAMAAEAADVSLREAAAANPALPRAYFDKLLWSGARPVLLALAKNPSTPPEMLEQVQGQARALHLSVAEGLAQNPSTPPALLVALAGGSNSQARSLALQNPSLPEECRRWLARLGSPDGGRALRPQDPDLLAGELAALAERGPWFQYLVIQHPNTPDALRRQLSRDPEPWVRAEVASAQATPAALVDEFSRAPDAWLRFATLNSPHATEALVERLACDPKVRVRAKAAAHPLLSFSSLERLSREPSAQIQGAVIQHPKSGPLLSRLAGSSFTPVRLAIANHPNTPLEALVRLCWDLNGKVRVAATVRKPEGAAFVARAGVIEPFLPGNQPLPSLSLEEQQALLARGPMGALLLAYHPETAPALLELLACIGPSTTSVPYELWSSCAVAILKRSTLTAEVVRRLSRHPIYAIRSSLAMHASLTSDAAEALVDDPHEWVQQQLADHPQQGPAHLLRLADSRFASVRARAVRHPAFPAAQRALLQAAGSSPDLARLVAPDLSVAPDALRALAAGGWWSRRLVARHPKSPPEVLEQLAGEPGLPAVWLAANPSTPGALLIEYAQRMDGKLRRAAAQNPSTPREALALLRRAGAAEDLSLAGRGVPVLSPEDRARLATGGPFARLLLARLPLSREERQPLFHDPCPQVRATLARQPGLAPDELSLLVHDEDAEVRRALRRVVVPPGLLARLAQRPEVSLRVEAASHPGLPLASLEVLRRDPATEVRAALARRVPLPEALHALAEDESVSVLLALAKNASSPAPLLSRVGARAAGWRTVLVALALHPAADVALLLWLFSQGLEIHILKRSQIPREVLEVVRTRGSPLARRQAERRMLRLAQRGADEP